MKTVFVVHCFVSRTMDGSFQLVEFRKSYCNLSSIECDTFAAFRVVLPTGFSCSLFRKFRVFRCDQYSVTANPLEERSMKVGC